jgi:hypothetical protein
MPRIDDLDSNHYELYKKTDQLPEELTENNEITESNLDEVFKEYQNLENENILNIKKNKFQSIASKLSQELDQLNKYPVPDIDPEITSYETSQVCMFITVIIYFALMFYFRSIFVLLVIPLMLYIFNKFNLI